ncbi:Fatty acid synthase, partial [Gonioctena quinquepunctata]
LYVNGHNPQLAYLYPDIEFPVSRGTRMISPYIKWKHERLWFNPLYDQLAKIVAKQGTRTVNVQLSDTEWSYIDGHVIDGRNLFPASGYLFLAWKTLCMIDGDASSSRNVVFENCRFMRGTTVPSKGLLKLRIDLNRTSGFFEIIESDSAVMTGKIYVVEGNDSSQTETLSYSNQSKNSNLQMKTKDIYEELRLRGYNYKGGFRNIMECDISATEGRIRWENNWVTFLDNMLQMKILGYDSRLLYIPTYIDYLSLPAKDQTTWIQENYTARGIETIFPVYNNQLTGEIRSGCAVIKGLIASSIARRKDFGVPVLEKYTFVPNMATLDLHESVRVNTQILLENALFYKVKVVELIDEFTEDSNNPLSVIVKTCFDDQPLIQTIPKILCKETLELSVPVENKKLTDEKDCTLIIVPRLFDRPEVLQTAFESLKENGFLMSRESNDFDIANVQKLNVSVCTVHKTPLETLVLCKRNHKPKMTTTVRVNSSGDFKWVKEVRDLIKNKSSDNVVLYSYNEPESGILGLVNCLRREPESSCIKCLFIMDPIPEINIADTINSEQMKKNMAVNVFKNDVWGSYRHLLVGDLNTVESEHCLAYPKIRGDLSSLQWIEGPLRHNVNIPPEKKLAYVHYVALNFRDVMTATGKINVDVITTNRTEQECVQGFEFSGRDQEGNRIMGMTHHGALSSLIMADDYLTVKIPDELSFEDAATITVVYGTVFYSLYERTRIRRGESMLIHSGTGGVGQAAIRVALYNGCQVFTTVGSQEKREYLKETFPALKDHHIGNSRDISFEKMVMRGTKGRGVDIVLNSLADEKLQASIRCLARGGRFLEIGKFDLANNTSLNLLLLQKGASFHGVMLDQLMSCTSSVRAKVMKDLRKGMKNGCVKPLDATVFEKDQLEEAFRFMASGKHMGKVVIKVRESEPVDVAIQPVLKFPCTVRYACYPEKSYIIVGGLGGFGLELADWLVLRGARKLVLTSRKGVSTGYQSMRINCWKSYGVNVLISKCDITTREGCRTLLEEAQKLGEVKAIFNLAVVLADAIFENQTEETFATSFGPKPIATRYLDEISRELCSELR